MNNTTEETMAEDLKNDKAKYLKKHKVKMTAVCFVTMIKMFFVMILIVKCMGAISG